MRTLKLDTLSFIASPNEKKFILLRSEKADNPKLPRDLAQLLVALGLQTYISVKKAHKNIIP